ncbi:restriction endonuclease subunit S [Pseudoalteromonas sp. BZP1]|uniref:restriction endonuclease subunit S n=1 Tax=unclassified Pseudoalteromonas TaxID=194690 RepID=UPI0032C44408
MAESKIPNTNAEQLITEHLDIWTTAIEQKSSSGRGSSKKFSLYGIKKLRKLILELAVRGKLVQQDSNDKPVDGLLKLISDERDALEKQKKIRKIAKQLEIKEDEKLFSIPKGWQYVRFGELTFNRDGERKPVAASQRKELQGEYDYYGASGVIDKVNEYLFDKSLLLIGEDGANLISRSTPIAFIAHGKYWVNNHAHVIDGVSLEFLNYIALFINAISLEPYITGTAQPKMNQAKMNSIPVAVPPIEEQQRIVAKVDELMDLCDALEAQTESSITAHQTLVEVLLAALLKTPGQTATPEQATKQFQQNWQRLSEHFDTLFTTTASIDTLQETILQLAVMGKLVPQNPNDEPASVLLERIAAEKAQLVKDKKIKKPKVLPEISEDEKPFELPIGWEFVRFNDLGEWGAGSTPRRGNIEYYNGSIPWFKSGELNSDYISESEEHISELALKETSVRYNNIGDVLVAMYGATIGKTSILSVRATTNQAVCACTPFNGFKNTFLLMLLKASKSRLIGMGAGGAQPNISREKIINTVIALPPTSEQHCIVAKVDELMALCDQLKARITDAQTTKLHLTDAIVEQAL